MSATYSLLRAAVAGLLLGVTWALLESQERRAKARRVFNRIMETPAGVGESD